jgi:aspartyl-tRNA(Asn)/glutamyl-tRNA(Gln) amidotransferase subunit B
MRKKEGVVDYRYFPDPNLVPIELDQQWIDDIQNNLVELPQQRRERYLCLGLDGVNANILVNNKSLSDFYDAVVSQSSDPLQSANYLISEVLSLVEKDAVVSDVFDACEIATLLKLLKDNTLSSKQSKQVLPELVNKHKRVEQVMKEKNLVQISDPELILRWIEDILGKNPQVITDFKNGKDNSVKFVMGQVMKVSKGQANPALSNQLVIKTLQSK